MNAAGLIRSLLPEVILLATACAAVFVGQARSRHVAAWVKPGVLLAIAAAALTTLRSGQFLEAAGLSVGSLTGYIRLITLGVGAVLVLVNWHQAASDERGEYFAMLLFSMTGVMLIGSSNDLILLFLGLELVSIPTYVLVILSRTDIRAQEAAAKYFFLGALAAALTAYGLTFLYGAGGTTTLFGGEGSLAGLVQAGSYNPRHLLIGWLLTFGGLSFKIAAVPFHGYVADVYQGSAAPLAGVLAFLPKLAGFVALIKLSGLVGWHWHETPVLFGVLWVTAALTMTVGNVLALLQSNVKRMLAYSSVAHSGYMLVGILAGPVVGQGPFGDGLSAMLFYIAVYGLMNLGAFAVLAALSSPEEDVEEQHQLAGLSQREPLAAVALAVCMFSLMGLPPTAGFLGKVYIFSSAFAASGDSAVGQSMIVLAVIGVLNSAIAAAYYLRVVGVSFLEGGVAHLAPPSRLGLRAGTAICAVAMIVLFVWPEALAIQAGRASAQISEHAPMRYAAPASSSDSRITVFGHVPWERDAEGGSVADLAVGLDGAAVGLDDLAAD